MTIKDKLSFELFFFCVSWESRKNVNDPTMSLMQPSYVVTAGDKWRVWYKEVLTGGTSDNSGTTWESFFFLFLLINRIDRDRDELPTSKILWNIGFIHISYHVPVVFFWS